jgi:hypothetical protein
MSERLSSAAEIRCTNRAASAGEKRSSPGPELEHLAGRSQPRYRQRRIGPRDQHDLRGWREMHQEERHLLVAGGLGDRLVAVNDENDRSREARQLIEQDRERFL